MGSTHEAPDELIVLVTGFGPFKGDYPRNPSWDIAASLPTYLPTLSAKTPAALRGPSSNAQLPVRIVVHPEPVRVTYAAARELVPKLWQPEFSGVPRVDFVLHIGMASPRPQYVLEQLGHRDQYMITDLDGKLPVQETDVPSQLLTDLDVEDVRARWEAHLPNNHVPLKVSNNAGHFLCDYIYFQSLSHCFRADQRRRVAFLHVPAHKPNPEALYDEHIATGREIAIQLVRSIVESELSRQQDRISAKAEVVAP